MSEPDVEFIEANEKSPDAANKFWEIEVTKADIQKEVGEDYFTDNTYSYLRLGTIEHNTVYDDHLKVDRALGDTFDFRSTFANLQQALEAQAAFIDSHLSKQRAQIAKRLPLLRAEKQRAEAEKQALVAEKSELIQANRDAAEVDVKQAQIDGKQQEIAYYDARIAELEEERDALPQDNASLIARLAQQNRDAAANPDDAAKREALEASLKQAAQGAKVARRQSSTATEQDRGDDLAAMVTDYYDDYRMRGSKGETQCYISEAEREQESARIHTKGGWRDHTNGNRISTTRGDKVEVIRGNYSLLVLGRQDEPGMGAKWESGGGHYARDNDTQTPGAVFEIRWVQDPWGGTWRCIEETTKGDVINRYQGNVEEQFFGDTIKSTTGSETAGVPIGGSGARRTGHTHPTDEPWISGTGGPEVHGNPTIIEKTWATKIESYTGSAACPIPKIEETTWADETSEETHVLGTSMSQSFILNQVEHTINGAANSSMTICPVLSSLQITATEFDLSIAGLKMEMALAPLVLSIDIAALKVDIALAALKVDIDMTALLYELHGGIKYEVSTTADVDNTPVKIGTKLLARIERSPLHFMV